jgi:hypothetical protein
LGSFAGGYAALALSVDKLTVALLTELFAFFKPPLFLFEMFFLHDHIINDLVRLATHAALCFVLACPVNLVDHCAGIATPLVFIDLNIRRLWLRLVLGLRFAAHSALKKLDQAVIVVPAFALPLTLSRSISFRIDF